MRRAARVPARSSMSATDPSSRSAGRTLSAMTDPRARAGRSSRPPDAPENAGTCSSCTRITRRRDTWGSRTTTSVSSRRADAELPRSQNCCAIRAPGLPGPTTSRSCSADRRPKRSTTSQGRAMLTRSSSAPRPFEDYDEGSRGSVSHKLGQIANRPVLVVPIPTSPTEPAPRRPGPVSESMDADGTTRALTTAHRAGHYRPDRSSKLSITRSQRQSISASATCTRPTRRHRSGRHRARRDVTPRAGAELHARAAYCDPDPRTRRVHLGDPVRVTAGETPPSAAG